MRPGRMSILLLCLAAPLIADDDAARQAQVSAATNNALDAIQNEIESQPVTSQRTIKDVLLQTHSEDTLRQFLAKLAPVGGARWLDDQTCQVRIEADGAQIADLLNSIAQAHADAGSLDGRMMEDLRNHRFEATSTSAAANTINSLAPAAGTPGWRDVSPSQRRQALIQARQNAAEHVLEMLRPIQLADGNTIAQAMTTQPELRTRLLAYLQTVPVTSVDFGDNLQVTIQLRPSWQELAQIIYVHTSGKSSSQLNTEDYANLQQLRDRISKRLTEASGTATVVQSSTAPELVVSIPQQPPAWVDDQLEVTGHGLVPGSQLKSSRAAEHEAKLKLRSRLEKLHLDGSRTVLDAASADPHVVDAINQTLDQARPYKSEFNSDGSVTIHEILDLHDFWQALTGTQ